MIRGKRIQLIDLLDSEYIYSPEVTDNFVKLSDATDGAINVLSMGNIVYNERTLTSLSDEELYWLTVAINRVLNAKIDIDEYFTDGDKESALDFKEYEKSERRQTVFKIENVVEVIPNKEWYVPSVRIQDMEKYFQDGLVTYNPRTQRPLATKKYGKKLVKRIDINQEAVKQISEEILKGTFPPSEITLNILSGTVRDETGDIVDSEKFKFTPYNFPTDTGIVIGRLEVEVDLDKAGMNKQKRVDILDGQHRKEGCSLALRSNPDIDQLMQFKIVRMTEGEARHYINIKNKTNPFKEESKDYYDATDINVTIIDDLNTKGIESENIMRNKVSKIKEDALIEGTLTTYEILGDALKDIYKLKQNDMRRSRISRFITSYFNELISLLAMKEDIDVLTAENIIQSRTKSLAFEPNMFLGYIALSHYLYTNFKTGWEDELLDIINKIDFDKNNPLWKGLGLGGSSLKSAYRNKIYKVFANIAEGIKDNVV